MIRLGYEIGTGRAVDVPLDHTAVTGRTQQSGKTTTLEALVHRSGKRAVVFVTKKAESGFRDAVPIPPYFRDSADWQFVSTIMEALMGERMKFERSWIINACKGASTLAEVHENIVEALDGVRNPNYGHKEKGRKRDSREWVKKPASGINEGVLTSLNAYLDIVIPQLQRLPYTKALELQPGLNVMDLSEYTTELQGLVIRSVLKWVYERETHTIVIIPEAWEFIPQQRKSPVLLACEELIRKGAAAGNFVWLDAQDIAAMHKNVLRSVGVWILGVQREQNEIKRLLAHIPDPKPTPTAVMKLERGQFFACFKDQCRRVYVQPFWISPAHAEAVACGEQDIATVEKIWQEKLRERKRTAPPAVAPEIAPKLAEAEGRAEAESVAQAESPIESEDDAMWKGKFEELEARYKELESKYNALAKLLEAREAAATASSAHAGGSSYDYHELTAQDAAKAAALGVNVQYSSEPEDRLKASTYHDGSEAPRLEVPTGSYGTKFPIPDSRALEIRSVALSRENIGEIIELLRAQPEVIELLRTTPTLKVKVKRHVLQLDDTTLIGKISVLVAEGFFNQPKNQRAVYDELKRRWGVPGQVAHVYGPLEKLNKDSLLTMEKDEFQVIPGLHVDLVEA